VPRVNSTCEAARHEGVVVLSPTCPAALQDRAGSAPGSTARWPSPLADLLGTWLRKAYALAKITPQPGGMWHPLRRK
jgi:hypothetical protein